MIAALLEEIGHIGQREDRVEVHVPGRLPAGIDEHPTHPSPLHRLGDGQAFQLGQVLPEHMQGGATDDRAILIDRDEKFADRFVQLAERSADHQLAVGEGADQVIDRRHVADLGGADVQSRKTPSGAACPPA